MERKYLALLYIFYFYGFGIAISNSSRRVTVPNCGKAISATERISGGQAAEPGQFPWVVSLYEYRGQPRFKRFKHVCGGTVLNENWIITAAHCVHPDVVPSKYHIVAGLHSHPHPYDHTIQVLPVSKIVVHENYDIPFNDIALLKTTWPLDIAGSGGYINGICLPKPNSEPKGHAIVAGRGDRYPGEGKVSPLTYVEIPILPRQVCSKLYDSNPLDEMEEVIDSMICAGKESRGQCSGDSGGPLFQINRKGIAKLIGITSFKRGCGEEVPGVYTKVSHYRKWIRRVVLRE